MLFFLRLTRCNVKNMNFRHIEMTILDQVARSTIRALFFYLILVSG